MGTSAYNGTDTGFGASTSEGSRAGYSSLDKTGSKNVKFNVGGQNKDLKGRNQEGYEFLLNGIDSKVFTTGSSIINWVQPKLTEDSETTKDIFSVYYVGNSVDNTFLVHHLFDNNDTTYGYIGLISAGSYSIYYNPIPFRVTQLIYTGVYNNDSVNYGLTHIFVAGSNDGETWTTLKDIDIPNTTVDLSSNSNYFKYYKLSGSVADGGKFPAYANCTITATIETDVIGDNKYNVFLSKDGKSIFETGEFYRQPDLNLNIVKHGNLIEEIIKNEINNTLNISNYNFSNFSANNYLKLPEIFNPTSNTWEMLFHIKTPSTIGNYSTILGAGVSQNYQGVTLQINTEGKLSFYLSSNGTSWNIASGVTGETALNTDTWYYVRIKFTGSTYTVETSTDNTTYATVITVSSSTVIFISLGTLAIGNLLSDNNYYKGTIDLYNSYIKIDNNYFWIPVEDGMIWEDTSEYPVNCWKYNKSSNIWNNYNNILLGYIELSDGNFVGVKNEPFNSFNTTVPNYIKPASIIDSGILNSSGNFYNQSWYNLYSDGWLEQGVNFNQTTSGTKTFTFIKPFKDTYYNVSSSGAVTDITKTNKSITISHDSGTGDFIASGYYGSSGVVRKYYKYVYQSWTQPTLTENGTFGGNKMAISIDYGSTNSQWGNYTGFSPNTGRIGFYRDEAKSWMSIKVYTPILLNLTNISFTVPTASWVAASSAATNVKLYGGTYKGDTRTLLKDIGWVNDNSSYSTTISTPNYYQYYTLYMENQGGANNDELEVMYILFKGISRIITEGTPTDYDFYEDVAG